MSVYQTMKGSHITVDGVEYPTDSIETSITRDMIDVTNTETSPSGGDFWAEFLNGFKTGAVNFGGPWNPSKAPIGEGDAAYLITVSGGHTISGNIRLIEDSYSAKIKDAWRFSVKAKATGVITIT